MPSSLRNASAVCLAIFRLKTWLKGLNLSSRRGQTLLIERERIKRQTIANRRLLHRRQVT
jgi:hypothetical protein